MRAKFHTFCRFFWLRFKSRGTYLSQGSLYLLIISVLCGAGSPIGLVRALAAYAVAMVAFMALASGLKAFAPKGVTDVIDAKYGL